jgi:hypothetical protein
MIQNHKPLAINTSLYDKIFQISSLTLICGLTLLCISSCAGNEYHNRVIESLNIGKEGSALGEKLGLLRHPNKIAFIFHKRDGQSEDADFFSCECRMTNNKVTIAYDDQNTNSIINRTHALKSFGLVDLESSNHLFIYIESCTISIAGLVQDFKSSASWLEVIFYVHNWDSRNSEFIEVKTMNIIYKVSPKAVLPRQDPWEFSDRFVKNLGYKAYKNLGLYINHFVIKTFNLILESRTKPIVK